MPFEQVMALAGGFLPSFCLRAIVELDVANRLGDAPMEIEDLAKSCGLHAGALQRVLWLLSANGIFEISGTRVAHNAASRLLAAGHPQSLDAMVRMITEPVNYLPVASIGESLKTGKPSAPKVFPEGYWGYLAAHPEVGRIFDGAMAATAHGQIAAVLGAYDFYTTPRIADIGGGSGHLLKAILARHSGCSGVLFDQQHVVAAVKADPPDRMALKAGDFFQDNLPQADAYLLMEVLHDWTDADAIRLLGNLRRAAPAGSKLIVIEGQLADKPTRNWTQMLDVFMLALFAGSQRTESQYTSLAGQSGFRHIRTVPNAAADLLEFEAV